MGLHVKKIFGLNFTMGIDAFTVYSFIKPIVPGLPTNVRVTTSTDDCTQVDLNWDPPPIENRYGT